MFLALTPSAVAKGESAGAVTWHRNDAADGRRVLAVPAVANPASSTVQYGIQEGGSLYWMSQAQLSDYLNDALALGVKWIRLDCPWPEIQPSNSKQYLWSNLDRVVAAANARGLKLLVILDYTPAWARSRGATSEFYPPAHAAAFAKFCAAAVRRYAPRGVHDWELWNEPNVAHFWKPAANPQTYAALVRTAVPAMRAIDPKVFVVSGGLAWFLASRGPGSIAPLNYLAGLCADGVNRYVNAIGWHPYCCPAFPSDAVSWSGWHQMRSIPALLAKYGTPGLPIWATEFGAPTGGPDEVSDTTQAAMATDAVKAAKGTPNLATLFWYDDQDVGTDQSIDDDFFGLRNHDGSRKPAWQAFATAIASTG
jgi:hypothetical protein